MTPLHDSANIQGDRDGAGFAAGVPGILVVMGVCGCGKSSVGAALAAALGRPFLEGDDLHPPANRARMAAGIALTDEDRRDWLDAIAGRIARSRREGIPLVVACSALKRRYRDRLRAGGDVVFVHLRGDIETIRRRVLRRSGHFMPVSLVESQFADLEEPQPDEHAFVCDIGSPPHEIVAWLLARLAAPTG